MMKIKISKSMLMAFSLSFQLGFTIALPLIFLALFGRYLDKKFATTPLFLLLGIFLALFLSTFLIYKRIKKIQKESEKE